MISFAQVMEQTNRNLDKHQIEAIYCDDNCVVSAGAGSGKTTVLSYRFLRLVLEQKADCDQILTLTFTRKAAREMRERIHKQLLAYKDDPLVSMQLAKFPDSSIATLDSFCSTIVRCDCTSYGIASDFGIDDELNKKNAVRCARSLLEKACFGEGGKILARLYTPDDLIDTLLVPLATRHYYLPQTLTSDATEQVLAVVQAELDRLLASFTELLETYAHFTERTKSVQEVQVLASSLLQKMEMSSDSSSLFALLGDKACLYRKPGKGSGEDFTLLKETTEDYRVLRRKICIALCVLNNKESLASVVEFVSSYIEAYQKEKRKSAVLTFSDVSSLAVEILKNNTSLRGYFKAKFRYIMIDEFQDNNQQQKDLLYLLAEKQELCSKDLPLAGDLQPDKLFFVGDEKQSIYRFRGADVRVFKELSSELVKFGGKALFLDTNYRSEPALIDLFNDLFVKVMRNEGQSYEADFAKLGTRSASEGVQPTCTVLVKPYDPDCQDDEDSASSIDAEAFAVSQLMRRMLDTDDYLIPSKEGVRRPKPSDMALLMRSTANQLSFEKAFRRYSIPYTVQSARSLMLEAPANDLYALLQLTLYPEDRHAYLMALRSPFCMLSDEAILFVLSHYEADGVPFAPCEILDGENRIRYDVCASFFSRLCDAVKTKSLSEIVLMLWYESGYYLSLVSHSEYQIYLEHFNFLHRLAQMKEQEALSVSQFLDYIRENLGQNEKLSDLDVIKEQGEGVHIMSIHKSKGLEFPLVFLGGAGSGGSGRKSSFAPIGGVQLPNFMSSSFFISDTKTETVKHGYELFDTGEEKLIELAELKRLLYVALTRAETHLVISGCFNKNNRNTSGSTGDANLLLLCCHSLGIDIEHPDLQEGIVRSVKIEDIPEQALYNKISGAKIEMEKATSWYEKERKKVNLKPLRLGVTSIFGTEEKEGEREGDLLPLLASDALFARLKHEQISSSASADFGTFVHALCEARLMRRTISDELSLMPPSLYRVLGEKEHKLVLSDARRLCDNFFASELYETYVLPYSFECEVKFFSSVFYEGREVVVEGSIDLLVEMPDAMLVLDFKTDAFRQPEIHRLQIETYMQAVARIYEKPVRGCVTFLRECKDEIWWS